MLGESQVCDRDGTVLARLALEDGEGHTSAEVELGPPRPLAEIEDRFWIPRLTLASRLAWHSMNAHGSLAYGLRHARGGFPWQKLPAADLPDEIPPGGEAAAPTATSF